jgi:predicted transcriptional regulator
MKNAKQSAIEVIENLPDDSSYEDIMERLFFLQKVESGLKDIKDGKVISHEEVKKRLSRWLK